MEENTISIEEIFYAIKKRLWLVILLTVLFASVAAYFSSKQQPSYEGRVKIFAGKTANVQEAYSSGELKSYTELINSYIEIARTEDFMKRVNEKGKLNMTAGQLLGGTSFRASETAPILTISYRAADEKTAEKVATALSKEFEAGVQEIILNTYTKVIDSVKVITHYPNKRQPVIIAALLGIMVSVGIIFLLEYLNDTLAKKEDLEKLVPVPVLGEITFEGNESKHTKKRKSRRGKKEED